MPRNSRSLDTEMSKISIRLTFSQRRVVEERAKAANKTVSDYVRGLAMGESSSFSILVDIALDNAAKVVAKIHTIPNTPGFKDPMRLSTIDSWSRKYMKRENG